MGVAESLLVAGIVCIVASVVGGGVKMLGAEMPVLSSFGRQALLFAVGLAFLFASFIVMQPKAAAPSSASPTASASQSGPAAPQSSPQPAPAVAQAKPAPAPVAADCVRAPLDCLPRSTRPANFRDPGAAGDMAALNIRNGLSTTEAAADAARQGATGDAARLCGIIASNDSSALGKHMAALRLTTPGSASGQPNAPCLQMAQAFL
jgi:hypothetical protein